MLTLKSLRIRRVRLVPVLREVSGGAGCSWEVGQASAQETPELQWRPGCTPPQAAARHRPRHSRDQDKHSTRRSFDNLPRGLGQSVIKESTFKTIVWKIFVRWLTPQFQFYLRPCRIAQWVLSTYYPNAIEILSQWFITGVEGGSSCSGPALPVTLLRLNCWGGTLLWQGMVGWRGLTASAPAPRCQLSQVS